MARVTLRLLPASEYDEVYSGALDQPQFNSSFTKADLKEEFDRVHSAIRAALSARWEEDSCGEKDFAIADEWSGARHHSGGIYSDRIIGPEYPEVVASALLSIPNGQFWSYHTAVEPQQGRFEFQWGDFFIRDGVLYASAEDEKYDYESIFTRKPNQA
jgi:hypothetical protein